MTLAMGRLCYRGALLIADTHNYLSDGTTRKDYKILHFDGTNSAFAISDASEDANAAKSLVSTIGNLLAKNAEQRWETVEGIISAEMTSWHKAFRKYPTTHIVAAIMLKGVGVNLYFCQPPRTIIKADGYVAHGVGAWITDILQELLFDSFSSDHPQAALRQMAYLVYRANKENAFCRGIDGFYLDIESGRLRHLNPTDMQDAITASFQLDHVLKIAASSTLGRGKHLENNAAAVRSLILQCDKIRSVDFRDISGSLL